MTQYRVKEHRQYFTPQRKLFGFWKNIGPAQPTMEAASQIIRQRMKAKGAPRRSTKAPAAS